MIVLRVISCFVLSVVWMGSQHDLEASWHESAPPFSGEIRDLSLRPVLKPALEHVVRGPQEDTALFADFRGKLVLLNFWATWCPPCVKEMPSLDRLEGKLGGADFEVVALSLDKTAEGVLDAFFESHRLTHLRIYWDRQRKAMLVYRLGGLPTSFLISPDGDLVATLAGPADWDSDEAEELVRYLIRSWKKSTK